MTATKEPLGVPVKQVPLWLILDGIGHAVGQRDSGWTWTICGVWTTGDTTQPEVPKRICRKCRAALAKVRLAPGE